MESVAQLWIHDSFYSSINITGLMLIYTQETQNPTTFSIQFWLNMKKTLHSVLLVEFKMVLLSQQSTSGLNLLVMCYDSLNLAL